MIEQAEYAKKSFLDRYEGGTRALYELDLRIWFEWCAEKDLPPLEAKRPHLESFGRDLQKPPRNNSARSTTRRLQTLRSFYRLCVADELIERDPTNLMRMPKWQPAPGKITHLDRYQVHRLLQAAEQTSPAHHALVAMMAMLGLRVSEACGVQIEHFRESPEGYTVLECVRKGGSVTQSPIPMPLLRIVERARNSREAGALILTRSGLPQTRGGAYDWVKRLAVKAGLPEGVHPHTLRHSSITALLEAGATLQEAQHFANHADIRTTMIYAHRKPTLDQHGAHIAARVFSAP